MGKYAIVQYPLLPDGGIDGRHLCSSVETVPFRDGRSRDARSARAGATVATIALLLRQGVDYRSEYPRFFDRIARSGQFGSSPPRSYVVHRFPGGGVPERGSPAFERLLSTAGPCAATALVTETTVLVPDC